jgi:hypothetical protein
LFHLSQVYFFIMLFRYIILSFALLQSCVAKDETLAQKAKDAAILETYGYYCTCKPDILSENIVLEFEKNDTLRKEIIYHSYMPCCRSINLIRSGNCPYELYIFYDTIGDSIKGIDVDDKSGYPSFLKNPIRRNKFKTIVKQTVHLSPDLARILEQNITL